MISLLLLVLVRCHIVILIRMRRRGKVRRPHQWVHNTGPRHPRHARWRRWQRRRLLLLKLEILHGWIVHHCCRHLLRWWLRRLLESVIIPAPFLLELFVEETDAPARLFSNLLEDLQHFLLLSSGNQTLCGDSK